MVPPPGLEHAPRHTEPEAQTAAPVDVRVDYHPPIGRLIHRQCHEAAIHFFAFFPGDAIKRLRIAKEVLKALDLPPAVNAAVGVVSVLFDQQRKHALVVAVLTESGQLRLAAAGRHVGGQAGVLHVSLPYFDEFHGEWRFLIII